MAKPDSPINAPAFRSILTRSLPELEWISLRDGAFRWFFSVYFLISTLQWALDHPLLGFRSSWAPYLLLFCDDLSAHWTGDVSYLGLNGGFLKGEPWNLLVLGLAVAGSALLLFRRRRAWGTGSLLVLGQLLGYSMGRRCISFDMIYFALAGYGAGLWYAARARGLDPARREELPVIASVGTLFSLYTLACIAKLGIAGVSWASRDRLGQLLLYGRFRHFVGSSTYYAPDFLVEYFSEPGFASLLATAGVLAVEGLSIFAVLLGNFSWLYAWVLIGAHVGMYFTVGILFHSVLGFLLLAAIPWNLLGRREPWAGGKSGRSFTLGLCGVLLLLCWYLPTSPVRRNVSLVWPFSRFNMFAYGGRPIAGYYFTDEKGALLEPELVGHELRLNVASINSMVFGVFGMKPPRPEIATYLCRFVREQSPPGGRLREMPLSVRVRYIHPGSEGRWLAEDSLVRQCGSP